MDWVDPSGSRVPPPPISSSLEDRRRGVGAATCSLQPLATTSCPKWSCSAPLPMGAFLPLRAFGAVAYGLPVAASRKTSEVAKEVP